MQLVYLYYEVMKLFFDFDGVVNFDASRTAYRKNPDAFGWIRRADYSSRHGWFPVNYSAELVGKLNSLKADYDFTWLWLTTWVDEAMSIVNGHLGAHGDGYIDWDPYTGVKDDNVSSVRNARKYDAVKANYDGKPFIWVDDEATVLYNPDDFDVPSLAVKPDPKYGVTRTDLDAMKAFLDSF